MSKKAVFHIGYPKTGTSALQGFFAENDALLKKYGYYYAERSFSNQVGNASDIYLAGLPGFDPTALARIFDADVERCGGDTILYSNENLFSLDDGFFAFLADYFDEVTLIVYLRRQDKWLESYKRWQIAAGFPLTHNRDEEPYYMSDYHRTLNMISKHIHAESIIIRPFERKQFSGGNINYDFLRVLGVPEAAFAEFVNSEEEVNISLNGQALVFKEMLNRYLPLRDYRLKNEKGTFGTWRGTHINKALGQRPLGKGDENFQVMSYQEKMDALKDVKNGNREIEQKFYGGKPLYLEPMPSEKIISYDDLDAETIKEVAAFAFKTMMDKMGGVSKDYLIASVAGALDAFDEFDRYADLFMDDWKLVEKSGLFDEAFYLRTNPQLPKETDTILHYLVMGHKMNLDPSQKFNTAQYKLDYPKSTEYDMCPLVHYLRIGKAAGNQPQPSQAPKPKDRLRKAVGRLWYKFF